MTLPSRSPKWTPSERRLYADCAVRMIGEVDHERRLLVEFLSGPLSGERRWFTCDELGLPPLLVHPPTREGHEKAPDLPQDERKGGDMDSETCTDDAAHSGATTEAA